MINQKKLKVSNLKKLQKRFLLIWLLNQLDIYLTLVLLIKSYHYGCKFNIVDIQAGQSDNQSTSCLLQLYSKNKGQLMDEVDKVIQLCETLDIQVDME
ncbi:unnamed protein product [Paramecium sonneborni]|uniref:Uncharacterized protein n=1 Tax=Paramecium sonneborni TaxID=65129 RepID=A0A8S1P4Z9_9CILI|nr:unnamed protein product [Paramecium sonneborni]